MLNYFSLPLLACLSPISQHLVNSKQSMLWQAEHSLISVTSTPLGPHLGPVTACSGLSASVSFVKCICRLFTFPNVKQLTGYYCQNEVMSLDHSYNPTSAWEIFGSALKCFDKVIEKQCFSPYIALKHPALAVHCCSLAIVSPLECINDLIMNSACFQRFNCLAINTSNAPSVKLPPISSSFPSFLSSNVRKAGSNGARLQRVRMACACMCF